MGKILSISVAFLIQLSGLAAAHFYYDANPRDVLIVVDSSYGLSAFQNKIEEWIDDYSTQQRYSQIHFATDKTYLGKGTINRDKMYRVNFGKMDSALLDKNYPSLEYDKRILLTFTGADVDGWEVVSFKPER